MTHRPAITLIEMLVSLAIMAIELVVIVNIFIASGNFIRDEQTRIDVGTSASRIFGNLDQVIRSGHEVIPSATIGGTTYTTSDTVLVLALPSLVGGQNVGTDDHVVIRREASTQQLLEIVDPFVDGVNPANNSTRSGGTFELTTGVKDIFFRYTTDDPALSKSLTVTLTTEQLVLGRAFTQYAIINATLRNHP